eukprot:CAMPEP_0183354278 /NCGR_PEP_ID=MMETSP0164_2-20130417/37216_1 /TAXON_ID=221442 /ORGANISM="Coccolithus pelagicus ssp braarudi, Strain PLY182g" /LENGTH=415 /DNA_ID=CAMNT_0025527133 /DNA_START=15 /DNA_END=1262 /DNA_ORIENTATION=+
MTSRPKLLMALGVVSPTIAFAFSVPFNTIHHEPSMCLEKLARSPAPRSPAPFASAVTEQSVGAWAVQVGRGDAGLISSNAASTAEALRDFWYVTASMDGVTEERIIAFPEWTSALNDVRAFLSVVNHIASCSDLCENLGETLVCAARHPSGAPVDEEPAPPCPMLLLRSFSGTTWSSGDEDAYFNGVDPFAALEAQIGRGHAQEHKLSTDAQVLEATHRWVDALIVRMRVCPFSSSVERAGLPAGAVSYPISRATTVEQVYQAFWEQVELLAHTDERQLSTVLLVVPDFAVGSADGYDAFASTLNEALTSMQFEKQLQLVFFHPEYTFRDGKQRVGGEGEAANFARRSPYPMINLLRTPQVRSAQKGIPTGSVYETNERNLLSVGPEKLAQMLQAQDWSGLEGREFEAHPTHSRH